MEQIKFRPIKNRVLAKQIKEIKNNKTASGILLGYEEEQEIITNDLNVLRVGSEVTDVKENDKVLFDGKGTVITLFEEQYILTTEQNIIGVYEK